MDAKILIATVLIELVLLTTRFIACWIKLHDRYGGDEEALRICAKWEIVPFQFEIDYFSDIKKGALKPPKITNTQSGAK